MKRTLTVLICLLALAACNRAPKDDGIATAGNNGAQPSTAPVASDPQERMRQFAQCMRDQGIDMPDPEIVEGEGGATKLEVRAGEGEPATGIDPKANKEKFQKAIKACEQYQPEGGPMGGKADPEMEEKMRQFAKCMRDNGVEGFPDPQEGGGIMIEAGPGEGGLNPDDPTFKAAQEKCGKLLPAMKTRTEAK